MTPTDAEYDAYEASCKAFDADQGLQRALRLRRARKILEEIKQEVDEMSVVDSNDPVAVRHEVDNVARIYCALLEAKQ